MNSEVPASQQLLGHEWVPLIFFPFLLEAVLHRKQNTEGQANFMSGVRHTCQLTEFELTHQWVRPEIYPVYTGISCLFSGQVPTHLVLDYGNAIVLSSSMYSVSYKVES